MTVPFAKVFYRRALCARLFSVGTGSPNFPKKVAPGLILAPVWGILNL